MPITSAKPKRFHSSPFGPHQKDPSVRTPSTSSATTSIARAAADSASSAANTAVHAPQLLHDRHFALLHALDPVAERGFDQADVAHQTHDAVRLERGGLVAAPHGAIERDVALDHAGAEGDGGRGGRNAG